MLYLVTSCPVEILLNNVEQDLQSAPTTSLGDLRWRRYRYFTVFVVLSFLSRNLQSLFRDYAGFSRDYSALSRSNTSFSNDCA